MAAMTNKPTVTAHAGSLGTRANTLDSFAAALRFPVDCLEADVRFSKDGTAHFTHDKLPPELQATATKLEELLALVSPHDGVRLNLDMKELSGVREMARLVERMGMTPRVFLTGLSYESACRVRKETPGLSYLLNADPSFRQRFIASGAASAVQQVRDCGALGLNIHYRFASRLLARSLADAGLALSVWTVDDERVMRRMLRLGAANITTRRIDRLLALRDAR